MQKNHENTLNKIPQVKVSILAPHLDLNDNIGGLFRICDALGAEAIYFGNDIDLNSRKLKKAARSTQQYVTSYSKVNSSMVIQDHLNLKYQIIGLELTDHSISIQEFKIDSEKCILLVIGNEVEGISEELLTEIPYCYHIDMYGKNSSMNVIQATSIALYHIQHALS